MSKAKKSNNSIIPSMLSFERKLECSDGLMHSGNWSDIEIDKDKTTNEIDGKIVERKKPCWKPISIVTRQNRSTQSSLGIEDIKKTSPNPASSDSDDANLPEDADTLKLSFSLRVIGGLGKPYACNLPNFTNEVEEKVKAFKEGENITDLARRYAYNIANGRFLWRNRVCAEAIEIHVRTNYKKREQDQSSSGEMVFNAYDFSLKDFDTPEKQQALDDLEKLQNAILAGLKADDDFILISVDAYVKLGPGQHVFPSQEMNMGEKKKRLFHLSGCAAMHNVKIGNAIRTIDTWYGDTMLIKAEGKNKTDTISIPETIKGLPIAIEPYGSVTQHGRAYRPSKIDLYTLMEEWVKGKTIEDNQQKYVVANLIRGGVFGGDTGGSAE